MKTVGVAALVVAVVMMIIGVNAGLNDKHETAIPAIVIALLALAVGAFLVRD